MKLPRDISGAQLAGLLQQFGYQITRQTGSHLRLTAVKEGRSHHITIPSHKGVRVGTLSSILKEVAQYIELDYQMLLEKLFGD